MSFFKGVVPKRKSCAFGYAREISSKLLESVPVVLCYLIAAYLCIGIAFQIGNAPHGCIDIDQNRTLMKSNSISDCDELSHNHTIYTETLAESDTAAIYIWQFRIKDLTFDQDATFGLVPDDTNIDFADVYKNKSFPENVYLVSKYNGSRPTTEALGSLQTDDIINFIYNTKTQTLSYIINNGPPYILHENIHFGKQLNYKFGVYLNDNYTSIEYIPHDIVKPDPVNATFNNTTRFVFTDCFECKESVPCLCENDVINHLYDDYTKSNKTWRICATSDCKKNGTKQKTDRGFIYHLLNENNNKMWKCMVLTNGKPCEFECIQKAKLLEHLNIKHYKGMVSIEYTPPLMTLNPSNTIANYDNCVSEHVDCPICTESFSKWILMISHISETTCYPNNCCPKCSKKCSGPQNLLIHLSKCYEFNAFKCNVIINGIRCRESYTEKRGMCKHLKGHYGKNFD